MNTTTSIAAYLQIDLLPVLILLLLYWNARSNFSLFPNIRRFCILLLLMIGILITDAVNWYLMGHGDMCSSVWLWTVNVLYYCFSELISYMWFLYVYHQLYGEALSTVRRRKLAASTIPLVVICAIILLSPWNRMIFYIDAQNVFCRGTFHLFQVFVGFGYMLTASILALFRRRKEEQTGRKSECLFLAAVVIFPLIGGLLQLYNFYLILLWPFSTIAIFLLYTNFQHTKISVDSLTGLNNRGHLEQYLQQKCSQSDKEWYLFFLDINKFKSINDQFGHTQGDLALCVMADALREAFGISAAFLARYGGDEFAVVMNLETDAQAYENIARLKQVLEAKNRTGNQVFSLHISVGFAKWDASVMHTFDDIMSLADERMYEVKQANK